MGKIVKIVLILSIILFIASIFLKSRPPDKKDILEELYISPIQKETTATPFEVKQKGKTYIINPLYNYELYGLVVTYHHTGSLIDIYHKRWGDNINLKDICVVWGENIKNEVYKDVKFYSGPFTAYGQFKDQETASRFKEECLSNNHLLSALPNIQKVIMQAERGDQIFLRGYLAKYSHTGGDVIRTSSTSRKDRSLPGKRAGSCETIYVTDFEILKKGNPFWHTVHSATKYLIIGCAILGVILFFKSPLH